MTDEASRLRAAMMDAHAHLIDRRYNAEWRAYHAAEALGAALGIRAGTKYEELHGPLPPLGAPDDLALVEHGGPARNVSIYLTSIDSPDE